MSTYTSEPGTLLAGRYRLVDQTGGGAGWTYWKATDQILARPVTVLTFAAGFPRTTEAVTAARAASRLSDPRFSQVFDVEDTDEVAYVVTEWVAGESLLDMLADGPLDPPYAVLLVREAARALAAAHATGLAHLRLSPGCLHWTAGGGVKITGLGTDAALAGTAPPASADSDDAVADTRGLAGLLYAALTGYWPRLAESSDAAGPAGPGETPGAEEVRGLGPRLLPQAPEADGGPCTPRQVSAAVPANVDAMTCQALFQRPSRHGPALSTPSMFADALASVARPGTLPVPPAPATAAQGIGGRGHQRPGTTAPYPAADLALRSQSGPSDRRPPDRSSPAAAIIGAVVILVLAAAGVAGWVISHRAHQAASAQPGDGRSSSAPSAAASVVLKPTSANSFDALGNDRGNEDGAGAKYAIAGIPGKYWHTDYYLDYPVFGNLKKGTGLILDMGERVRLSQVAVQFGPSCCAHVGIEIGNDNDPVPSALRTFTEVASSTTAASTTTFDVSSNTTGRYVLIWITYLPPLAGYANRYQAQIDNVVVHGAAVSQSG
jgi:hypothetical protein